MSPSPSTTQPSWILSSGLSRLTSSVSIYPPTPRALHADHVVRIPAHIADEVPRIVECDAVRPSPPPPKCALVSGIDASSTSSPPANPSSPHTSPQSIPTLDAFITQLADLSNIQFPTLLCTMVYLNRLRARLPSVSKRLRCTHHRLFLAAVIVAAKYLNDSSLKNKYWVQYSSLFTQTDVNLMEMQFLLLLDYDLRIDEPELLAYCHPLLAKKGDLELCIPPDALVKTPEIKAEAERYSRCATRRRRFRSSLPAVSTTVGANLTLGEPGPEPGLDTEGSVPASSTTSSTVVTPASESRSRHTSTAKRGALLSTFLFPLARPDSSVPSQLSPSRAEPLTASEPALVASAPSSRPISSTVGFRCSTLGNLSTVTSFTSPSSTFPTTPSRSTGDGVGPGDTSVPRTSWGVGGESIFFASKNEKNQSAVPHVITQRPLPQSNGLLSPPAATVYSKEKPSSPLAPQREGGHNWRPSLLRPTPRSTLSTRHHSSFPRLGSSRSRLGLHHDVRTRSKVSQHSARSSSKGKGLTERRATVSVAANLCSAPTPLGLTKRSSTSIIRNLFGMSPTSAEEDKDLSAPQLQVEMMDSPPKLLEQRSAKTTLFSPSHAPARTARSLPRAHRKPVPALRFPPSCTSAATVVVDQDLGGPIHPPSADTYHLRHGRSRSSSAAKMFQRSAGALSELVSPTASGAQRPHPSACPPARGTETPAVGYTAVIKRYCSTRTLRSVARHRKAEQV